MTTESRMERRLPEILEELYLGRTPDYRDEVLAAAVRTRQRPWWTFPGRWLPMADIASRPAYAPRLPWRAITVAFLIGALLLAVTVAYLGSRQTRVPPPFGLAENGLIAYSADGDIWTTDPLTGVTNAVVTGTRRRLGAHLLARRDEDRVCPQGLRQWQPRRGDRRRERGRVEPDRGLPTAGGALVDAPRVGAGFAIAAHRRGGPVGDLDPRRDGVGRTPDGGHGRRPVSAVRTSHRRRRDPDRPRHDRGKLAGPAGPREREGNRAGHGRPTISPTPAGHRTVRRSCSARRPRPIRTPGGCSSSMRTDRTSGRSRRRPGRGGTSRPSWSPDGKRIAFLPYERIAEHQWDVRPLRIYTVADGTVTETGPVPRDVRAANPAPGDAVRFSRRGLVVRLGSRRDIADRVSHRGDGPPGGHRRGDRRVDHARCRHHAHGASQVWQRTAP